MNRIMALAGAAVLALTAGACTTGAHTDASMLAGAHPMAPKAGVMSDKYMPSRSADCTEAALANMPPEHRQLCDREQGQAATR